MQTMDTLTIQPGTSTPAVHFDPSTGLLRLEGESFPENAFEFFRPLKAWLSRFLAGGATPVKVELRLAYLNTGSTKAVMDILDMLEDAHSNGRDVSVHWYYEREDERALEAAQELKEEVTLPFHITAVDHAS
jgi:hypothetical protein